MMWFLPNNQPKDTAEPLPGPIPAEAQQLEAVTEPSVHEESKALYIGLIFLGALSLRVLLFMLGPYGDVERAMYPDSFRYVELGEALVGQGAYGLAGDEVGVVHEPLQALRQELGQAEPAIGEGLRPEIMRTPGYPSFIGVSAWLGLGAYGVLLMQCLFSALSVTLVYGIGYALLKRVWPALIAAVIVALHPADVAAPSALLTETCFTLLVLLGLWMVADREARGIGGAAAGGLMIGLSVLVRPVSIFLGPAVAIWMIVTDPKLKTAFLAILMLALSLAPGAAWMARNNGVGFGYRLSSIPYINTYFYGNAYMRITEEGGDWKNDWPATVDTMMGELRAEQNLNPEADVFDTMKNLGVEAVREDPQLYGRVMKQSMLKFFTDHSLGGFYQQLGLTYTPTGLRDKLLEGGLSWQNLTESVKNPTGWLAVAWVGMNGVLLVGMVIGGIMLLVRRHFAALLLLGGVMCYFVFATQTTGLERFRLPVLGIQALLLASIWAPRKPRIKKAKKTPKRRWYEEEDDQATDEDDAAESGIITSGPLAHARDPEAEPEALARPL